MKEIIRKEAMKKFDEYMQVCYGNMIVEQEEPKKENIFKTILEEKPKKTNTRKSKTYQAKFPLKFYKNGYRLSARYGDFHICNCDDKDKLNVQKDFDKLKIKKLGLMEIRARLRPKYNKQIHKTSEEINFTFDIVSQGHPAYFGATKRGRGMKIQKSINGRTYDICSIPKKHIKKTDFVRYYLQENYNPKFTREDYRNLLKENSNFDFITFRQSHSKKTKPKKPKAVAPKKEVSEWDKLTWNERAHLLRDGEDTKILVTDFLDICSIMVNNGSGRALASHFNNVEVGTLLFLGQNYNTPMFNELYDQGKAVMNSMRGF